MKLVVGDLFLSNRLWLYMTAGNLQQEGWLWQQSPNGAWRDVDYWKGGYVPLKRL